MLKAIHFKNFKCLRDTKLPLEPFTLIIGPNGAGKSTALSSLELVSDLYRRGTSDIFGATADAVTPQRLLSLGARRDDSIDIAYDGIDQISFRVTWSATPKHPLILQAPPGPQRSLARRVSEARVFAFEATHLAAVADVKPDAELGPRGQDLVAVLDRLRDAHPERFEALNAELHRCLSEFDKILFDTPEKGKRHLRLRVAGRTSDSVLAADLSQGTMFALALLTLAYLPDPPPIVGLEEPDHGLHPRLLRDVRDALYRLAYPQDHGEDREPIQVIATTHSPVFLDLFRDHPEQVVIAEKHGLEARFRKLTECEYLDEILESTPLGEAWYTGVLGGVPERP